MPGTSLEDHLISRLKNTVSTATSALPEGTLAVGVGLALSGATTYAFLAIAARALGPERYAPLLGLWSLLFLIAPAAFVPLEQELGRALAARGALRLGARPLVRRVEITAGVVSASVVALALLGSSPLLDRLFDHDLLLLLAFVLGLVTYAGSAVVKGAVAGTNDFGAYGKVLAAEGLARVVLCAGFAAAGVRVAGPYGVIVGVAPLVALLFFPRREPALVDDGPVPHWRELLSAVAHLFLGAVFGALLLNAGPVVVKAISGPDDAADVSRFGAGLVIARVPLFLFQAIQVALLPKLSALAAADRHAEFTVRVRRLLLVVLALGFGSTTVAFAIGPEIVRTVFGEGFALGRADLAWLGLASTAYMVALTFAQALIAHNEHGRATIGWAVGCALFALAFVPEGDLLFRAERALFLGSVSAAVVMVGLFFLVRTAMARVEEEDVALVRS